MSPDTINALASLGDLGLKALLLGALFVVWKKLDVKEGKIEQLQASLLAMSADRNEQSKEDAAKLLDERTVVLPIVRDSTEALRRTTDQLAVTTSLIVELRSLLARHAPNGNR